jgi:hypothetical protein
MRTNLEICPQSDKRRVGSSGCERVSNIFMSQNMIQPANFYLLDVFMRKEQEQITF